jgi:hypothetical protein
MRGRDGPVFSRRFAGRIAPRLALLDLRVLLAGLLELVHQRRLVDRGGLWRVGRERDAVRLGALRLRVPVHVGALRVVAAVQAVELVEVDLDLGHAAQLVELLLRGAMREKASGSKDSSPSSASSIFCGEGKRAPSAFSTTSVLLASVNGARR